MDVIRLRHEELESIEVVAPYLRGYLGEHVSMYPGGYQLDNGAVINKRPTILGITFLARTVNHQKERLTWL